VQRCYAANRRAQQPLQLHLSSLEGEALRLMDANDGWRNWDVYMHETHFLEVPELPRERITYLTSDSEHEITTLEPGRAYIIGGLVDHNHHKGECQRRASEAGLATARLPIDQYLQMRTRHVLTIDHVFMILLRVAGGATWEEALQAVLPQRKGAVLKAVAEGEEGADAVEKQKGGDAVEKQTGTDAGEKQTGTDAVEKQTGTDAVEKQTGTDAVEKQTGTDAAEKQTGTDAVEEQTGTDAVEEQTGTDAVEEQTGTDAVEEQTGTDAVEEPTGEDDAAEENGENTTEKCQSVDAAAQETGQGTAGGAEGEGTGDATGVLSVSGEDNGGVGRVDGGS